MNITFKCSNLIIFLLILLNTTLSYNFGSYTRIKSPLSRGYTSCKRPPNGPPRPPYSTSLYGSIEEQPENISSKNNNMIENDKNKVDNMILKQWKMLSKDSQDDLKTVGASFFFALIIRVLLVEPRFIPSLSMFPTFDIGDQLLVDKISHIARPYAKRDVLVFNPSDTYVELTGTTCICKFTFI